VPSDYFEEDEFTGEVTGGVLKRIFGLLRQHWMWVAGFITTIIIVSILDAISPSCKEIIDQAFLKGDQDALVRILIRYASMILVQSAGIFIFVYLAGVMGERVRYDMRRMLFNHLQTLSLSYYSRTPVGWIMSRVTNDTERVAKLVTWGLIDSTWGVVNIATTLTFMFAINWQLALIVLAILPLLLYAAVQFRKRILKQFRKVRKINSRITASYNENISGVRVVKALGREDGNLDEFKRETGEMYTAGYRAAWLSALFLPIVQIISAFAIGGIIWYSGAQINFESISIGGIQAFLSYMTFMMGRIQTWARVHECAFAGFGGRIFHLIDTAPEIQNKPKCLTRAPSAAISSLSMCISGTRMRCRSSRI
jgi:ATP-binding cassette subfamily B protein